MPKGNILLVADSTIEDFKVEGFDYAFKLKTPFESLVLAAKSDDDRVSWKRVIREAIDFAQYALRGYMKKKGKTFLEGSPRKFFILWNNILR